MPEQDSSKLQKKDLDKSQLKEKKPLEKNSSNTDLEQQITQEIENGIYFKKALDWYLLKFCKPLFERLFWMIIAIIMLFTSYLLFVQIKGWFPLTIYRPLILNKQDPELLQSVKKLPNIYKNSEYAILEYLLESYVKIREEFLKKDVSDILEFDKKIQKIENLSTRAVSINYQKLYDYDNKNAPIHKLKKFNGIRLINIKEIKLNQRPLTLQERILHPVKKTILPNFAKITFDTNDIYLNKKDKQFWQANIDFHFEGVNIKGKKVSLTKFIVIDYKLTKL